MCDTIDVAEDFVQDTLLRAITHVASFRPGTNLAAWLITILRNRFRDQYRRRQREVEDAEGHYAEALKIEPEQTARIEFAEFCDALAKLPSEQRQALLLVGTSEISYEDAATLRLRHRHHQEPRTGRPARLLVNEPTNSVVGELQDSTTGNSPSRRHERKASCGKQ